MIAANAPWFFKRFNHPVNKVLLIDDDEIFNFVTKRIISRVEPEVIVSAFENPEVAFKILPSFKPDLVLLDLNMPHLNGWSFLDKMEEEGLEFPVIVLTSSILKEDKSKARAYKNVFGYITKPIEVKHLSAILKKAEKV